MVLVFDEEPTTHRQGDYKMAQDDYQNSHPYKGPGSRPYQERGLPNCPNMMGQGNDPVPPTSMAWPVAVSDDEQPTPRRKSISNTY